MTAAYGAYAAVTTSCKAMRSPPSASRTSAVPGRAQNWAGVDDMSFVLSRSRLDATVTTGGRRRSGEHDGTDAPVQSEQNFRSGGRLERGEPPGRLAPRMDAELAEDGGDVVVDRPGRHHELPGD